MDTTPVDREISVFTPTVQPEPFTLQTAGFFFFFFVWGGVFGGGFFKNRFEQKLWQVPLEWLKSGRVPAGFPGVPIRRGRE